MKILLGISGGIDSAYAAYLLKSEGHTVVGGIVKMHEYTDISGAESVCREIGIPLEILDGREEFEKKVIEPFCSEYLAGRTPNPCIICNPAVKLGMLIDYAKKNGFDRVATGHYCNIEKVGERYCIKRGADEKKDQSYMLSRLMQQQLEMLYFPLYSLKKETIRQETERISLSVSGAKDSQEICFIPDKDYASFIENRCGKLPPGDFISPEGKVCGKHTGILHYTVGQRKGLGIALGRPVFVSKIDATENRIYLSDSGGEYTSGAILGDLCFQLLEEKSRTVSAFVKTRYSTSFTEADIEINREENIARISFYSPARAITPGQAGVVYDGEGRILFSGFWRQN